MLLQGQLRIDPKSYKNAYVSHPVFFKYHFVVEILVNSYVKS